MGGGNLADRHADCAMVGSVEFLHQPDFIRIFQQEVPQGIHGHRQKQAVLRKIALLRNRGHDVLVYEHEEIVTFLQQQLIDEKTGPGAGQRGFLHLQQHRRLNPGNGLPHRGLVINFLGHRHPKIGQNYLS